jgi:hypothetical protein
VTVVTEMLARIYPEMLFLHLLVVVLGFSAGALVHFGLDRMRSADRADRALDGARLVGRLGPRMPLVALALLLTGAGLTQARWNWSTPWILVSIAGLVTMQVVSLAVLKPRMSALAPRLVIGIMFVMVTKPAVAGGVAALVVAAAAAIVRAAPWRPLAVGPVELGAASLE